jgi:hypothetical protein
MRSSCLPFFDSRPLLLRSVPSYRSCIIDMTLGRSLCFPPWKSLLQMDRHIQTLIGANGMQDRHSMPPKTPNYWTSHHLISRYAFSHRVHMALDQGDRGHHCTSISVRSGWAILCGRCSMSPSVQYTQRRPLSLSLIPSLTLICHRSHYAPFTGLDLFWLDVIDT